MRDEETKGTWETAVDILDSVPTMYIPALLQRLVQRAVKAQIFVPGKISVFVANVENKIAASNAA